jgi:hypothetical protein
MPNQSMVSAALASSTCDQRGLHAFHTGLTKQSSGRRSSRLCNASRKKRRPNHLVSRARSGAAKLDGSKRSSHSCRPIAALHLISAARLEELDG